MAHTIREKKKLLNRVRRIRGQVDAIEKALEQEQECFVTMQTIAACRGAINGLMAEIVEEHIRFHVVSSDARANSPQVAAAEELIDVVNTYLK
ncbi:MAG TPA: metal/formaldehyde-sensitive transcriptional repressor [Blastocatellia bacterium]